MNRKATFACALMLTSIASAQGPTPTQTTFMIGAYWAPRMSQTNALADEALLADLKNAGFNLVVPYDINDVPVFQKPEYMRYLLERVSKIPGLRTMVYDHRVVDETNTAVSNEVLRDWGPSAPANSTLRPFTTEMRDAVMGYLLLDEGSPANGNAWVNALAPGHPGAFFFRSAPGIDIRSLTYPSQTHIQNHMNEHWVPFWDGNNHSISAYHTYPFVEGGMRQTYFINHQLHAAETSRRKKSFWTTILSVNSYEVGDAACTPVPINDYAPITENNLRMQAFVPVLYGAKGITYFTYRSPGYQACIPGEFVYDNAIENSGTAMYGWAQKINTALTNMGPDLMALDWKATLHGSQADPVSGEPDLPIAGPGTPVVNSDFEDHFAVGVFSSRIPSASHALAVLNKDRSTARTVTLNLAGLYHMRRHNKTASTYSEIGRSQGTLRITVQPGDMELVLLKKVWAPRMVRSL